MTVKRRWAPHSTLDSIREEEKEVRETRTSCRIRLVRPAGTVHHPFLWRKIMEEHQRADPDITYKSRTRLFSMNRISLWPDWTRTEHSQRREAESWRAIWLTRQINASTVRFLIMAWTLWTHKAWQAFQLASVNVTLLRRGETCQSWLSRL